MRIRSILALLCFAVLCPAQDIRFAGAGFAEDFESVQPNAVLLGQNGWKELIYGKHPAASVSLGEDTVNRTKFIKSPGGGDHYNAITLNKDSVSKLSGAKVILLRMSVRKNASLWLGSGKDERQLMCSAGERLRITASGKVMSGIPQTRPGEWFDAAFAFELVDGVYKLYAGMKPYNDGKNEFDADPLIASINVSAGDLSPAQWNLLSLRLDGDDAADNIAVAGYGSMSELPITFVQTKKLEPVYRPIVDHILAPREVIDLSGVWEASPAPVTDAVPAGGRQAVVVPDLHSGLFSAKNNAVWFRKSFRLDRKAPGMRYFICFERVTDSCEVFVNGERAGSSDDGFMPFRIDVTKQIADGKNELVVKVIAPRAGPDGPNKPEGFDFLYGMYKGIPFPVHLERTGALTIQDVFVITKMSPSPSIEVRVDVANNTGAATEAAFAASIGKELRFTSDAVMLAAGEKRTVTMKSAWAAPHLWWPHDPFLYQLDVEAVSGGKTVDAFRRRFGFREVTVAGPDMLLNGVKLLHRRSSMIPYWNLAAEDVQRTNIALLRERGFNGYRLHGGPSLRIVRVCDELGWMVSPEAAICTPRAHTVGEAFWPNAEKHLAAMVRALRNSPSVIYWNLANEFASYYMKGTVEEKAVVDARMVKFGDMVVTLDPTRTWTVDGDGELGGVGKHGPAPTLNFHYSWQPFKTGNMVPNTSYWLDDGLSPWQGIIWDRTKPLLIGEDLHPPYGLKIPDGMSQWAGNGAYDPETGVYKAWFDCIRMLAPGYYHAGVSCWNIWATAELAPGNPLYRFGQPVPDILIAQREFSGNFYSGATASRVIQLYNKTFVPLDGVLTSKLTGNDKVLTAVDIKVMLTAGGSREVPLTLAIPTVTVKTDLRWILTLTDRAGKVVSEERCDLTAFPKITVAPPANCALVAADGVLSSIAFRERNPDIASALAKRPSALIIASYKLSSDEAALLNKAVSEGLKVLMIGSEAAGTSPVQIDARHYAAFAFVRAPLDPAVKGLDDRNLRLWEPMHLASSNSFFKPKGDHDIILDCGGPSGLQYTPLVRVYSGRGYYLLCQMPILESLAIEPAAVHLLQTLCNSLNAPIPQPSQAAALAGDADGKLAAALKKIEIPVSGDAKSPCLIVNGREALSSETLALIKGQCVGGGTVLMSGLSAENAAVLSQKMKTDIAVIPSTARQLLIAKPSPMTRGLSANDLCWYQGDDFADMVNAQMQGRKFQPKGEVMLDGELVVKGDVESPLTPAGLIRMPLFNGNLIITTIVWDRFLAAQPVKARRVIETLIHNTGSRVGAKSGTVRTYAAVDMRRIVNRGFWSRDGVNVPAWFGDPKDDMRYFPVNVTGNDPVLNMPQPPEKFPDGPVNYAGIDFTVIDPEKNSGKSCVVIAAGESMRVPVNSAGATVWIMGALDKIRPDGADAVRVTIHYADSSSVNVTLRAGVDLNGYHYPTTVSQGFCAWQGPTPSRKDAVLWCAGVNNPEPGKIMTALELSPRDAAIGIMAMSVESRD